MRGVVWDTANSCATINIASRYIIRSETQEGFDAETGCHHKETSRARFQNRPADHGAARSAGPPLDVADHVGAARGIADVTRAAQGLRRSFADGDADQIVGVARGRPQRARARRWLWPDRVGQGVERDLPAAPPLRGAVEQARGIAFSSEVDTRSREENASKEKTGARPMPPSGLRRRPARP